jgi:hypothetical protein
MDDLIIFAFQDLVSRLDELTIIEPRSFNDLFSILHGLHAIYLDFQELTRLIERVTSLNEE